jgi:hypothetical protein
MDVVERKLERTLQRVVDGRRHSVAPTAISIDPDKLHIPAKHSQGHGS